MTGNSESQPDLLGETGVDDTDNQQKRLMDLHWLAGIIEGEGCFTVQRKLNRNKPSYTPRIQITNTNLLILNKAERIIKENGLTSFFYLQKQKDCRPCYVVIVLGLKRVKRFIDVIDPFIECRRPQMETLQKYIEGRLSKPEKSPLDEQDLALADQLYRLNRPYLFSETNTLAAAA